VRGEGVRPASTSSVLRDLAIVVAGFAGLGVVVAVLAVLEDELRTPLWVSLGVFGVAVVVFLYVVFRPDLKRVREWRRRGRRCCPLCGYDRSGLSVDASCPECGRGV